MTGIINTSIALGPKKERNEISISELFHENSKLHPLTTAGKVQPDNYSASEIRAMSHGYKQYRWASKIKLPDIRGYSAGDVPFDEVVLSRRTSRSFQNEYVSIEDFSKILFQSYGITGKKLLPGGEVQYLRSAPSGGALYPAEIYIGIRKVAEIAPGIYHYKVPGHELELIVPGDQTESLYEICGNQEYARQASVVMLISGVLQRTKRKYGERGYRYVFLDVGHLGQNIYLACTALGLQVMTTCGFYDDEANRILGLDGIDESVLYVVFIG
jgi:SagB-type dehydrogenase family enzyme